MTEDNKPRCCAECHHSTFIGTPMCKIVMKKFEHCTAKGKPSWCPLKAQIKKGNDKSVTLSTIRRKCRREEDENVR